MGKIVAIGGEEIGGLQKDGSVRRIESRQAHEEIINLSGKKHPSVLFIPTAKNDSQDYIDGFRQYYLGLGCSKVDVLLLVDERPSKKEIKEKIISADIIYVNGGNTFRMLKIWKRRHHVERMLKSAYMNGTVMAGHSAGAICWFSNGNSDSFNKHHPIKVSALGLVDALLCPHYDTEPVRQKALKNMMKRTPRLVGLALDDASSIEIVDNKYRIINANETSKARRVYWSKGTYFIEEVKPSENFQMLDELLIKPK
jgi:dipeptidase E